MTSLTAWPTASRETSYARVEPLGLTTSIWVECSEAGEWVALAPETSARCSGVEGVAPDVVLATLVLFACICSV